MAENYTFIGKFEVVAESARAIKVRWWRNKEHKNEFWVPKRVLHEDESVNEEGDIGDLVVRNDYAQNM